MKLVVGIGLSSQATREEVGRLVAAALADEGATIGDVDVVATRSRFVGDVRIELGPPVTGFDDHALIAASAPVERTIGIPSRVAETAAALAAGSGSLPTVHTSDHVTVAVARAVAP